MLPSPWLRHNHVSTYSESRVILDEFAYHVGAKYTFKNIPAVWVVRPEPV